MTAKDAISPQIVPLRSATTYREGLEEMRNAGRHILPVVDDGVYIGLVSDSAPLYAMESVGDAVTVMKPVIASTPMPLLLWRMVDEQASIFPVVDDLTGDYIGAVDRESIIRSVARLFPQVDESTELTITCRPSQYSASAIAHAVEDADAHLLNLNVTAGTAPDCPTTVQLRVNHSRGESVARSLQRYGYETVEMTGDPGMFHTDLAERVSSLLHYLEI